MKVNSKSTQKLDSKILKDIVYLRKLYVHNTGYTSMHKLVNGTEHTSVHTQTNMHIRLRDVRGLFDWLKMYRLLMDHPLSGIYSSSLVNDI